jgi:hypothetical protein
MLGIRQSCSRSHSPFEMVNCAAPNGLPSPAIMDLASGGRNYRKAAGTKDRLRGSDLRRTRKDRIAALP